MPFAPLRGLLRRWTGSRLHVWHHPAFRIPIAGAHVRLGIEPRRADHVLTWLLDHRVVRDSDVHEAPLASWDALRRVHNDRYLATLDDREVVAAIVSVEPEILSTGPLLEMWRRAAGGVAAAVRHVADHGGSAAVLSGGFHHAKVASGAGFCGLNDVVVAVRHARVHGVEGRIAVIDLDAHPPDGVADCLRPADRADLLSLGVASSWELHGATRDLRVPQGSGDKVYLAAVDRLLRRVRPPTLAIVLAGADPLSGDRFGGLACSEQGLRERDARVRHFLGNTPTVWLPAGGYTPKAWRVFANALGLAAGAGATPPIDYDPLTRRTRRVIMALDPDALDPDAELFTTADLADALGLPQDEPRFLGTYTLQGIEYALARYGLLDTLRRMGFERLEVEMRTQTSPHLLRITAEVHGERALLYELSVSRRKVEGLSVLFIEWLTLRDPRMSFASDRPQLPGQEVPGLGMSREAAVLLRETARHMQLDGIAMVPSHFHVAWMARHEFRFVDATHQGRFEALCHHLKGIPLRSASALLEGAGVQWELGDNLTWHPDLMLIPLTDAATALLKTREREAHQVRASLRDSLLPVDR